MTKLYVHLRTDTDKMGIEVRSRDHFVGFLILLFLRDYVLMSTLLVGGIVKEHGCMHGSSAGVMHIYWTCHLANTYAIYEERKNSKIYVYTGKQFRIATTNLNHISVASNQEHLEAMIFSRFLQQARPRSALRLRPGRIDCTLYICQHQRYNSSGATLSDDSNSNVDERKYVNKKFSVDRSGMGKFGGDEEEPDPDNVVEKEELSELGKDLRSFIKLKGPVTVHDYMTQAANHGIHGYYQHKLAKIGTAGDFITAPEVSQLFGEVIGVWCVVQWQRLGSPPKIRLVELGPGKGTLMKDILRVVQRFPAFLSAVEANLVELSPEMRSLQKKALLPLYGSSPPKKDGNIRITSEEEVQLGKGVLSGLKIKSTSTDNKVGFQSPEGKAMDMDSLTARAESFYLDNEDAFPKEESGVTAAGVPIHWHSFLQQVPATAPTLFVSQEMLDAFPVHQFVYDGAKGWLEVLVDMDDSRTSPYHFRYVLSPSATPAVKSLLYNEKITPGKGKDVEEEDGAGMEVSPLSMATCEDIGARLAKCGGAALIIDYGEDFAQSDTLRGFYKHNQVSVLSQPGRVDVTCDVDFAACGRSAASKGALVEPLLTQGEFLMQMGIVSRVEQLVNLPSTSYEQALALVDSMKRLVEPEQMGSMYKALVLTGPENGQGQGEGQGQGQGEVEGGEGMTDGKDDQGR